MGNIFTRKQAHSYKLTVVNNSNKDWKFYIYQKDPNLKQPKTYSLAWLVSPYIMRVGTLVRFEWKLDYTFVWNDLSELTPGATPTTIGIQPCSLKGKNTTTFNAYPAPGLLEPTKGHKPAHKSGTLYIADDKDVPVDTFSVGIGMNDAGTFVEKAEPSLPHKFTPKPSYWVAAGEDVEVGSVLDTELLGMITTEVVFPLNVFSMKATLEKDNTWTIEKTTMEDAETDN